VTTENLLTWPFGSREALDGGTDGFMKNFGWDNKQRTVELGQWLPLGESTYVGTYEGIGGNKTNESKTKKHGHGGMDGI